ncbi:MazG nucleotide pyrophosphohydrolase domain-containing protein [Corynebacterium phoceense]|uniref:MazG nucleotide pyrophosphohydrolase domain-containing protein n=1 Tax=Corynebacterium phoceense TaxID=1686286 RepID=UPI00211CAF47|nr:MazG nucleotide pyrophosphohydrolase domain-containing protein [Corynebacterium phoceense]MCQ9345538.1 nucleoside triphosphate hydrolase [Corynebacterium phoceense]
MTVLLLDERWPDLIPMEALARVTQPVTYTGELPVKVRWNFGDLVTKIDPTGVGTIVTTNAADPAVAVRISAGEEIIEAASRHEPVYEAQRIMSAARSRGEWEMGQTHRSLLPYLAEETQEFAAAVEEGASESELCTELGDVLLQVLFHAEIAARRGAFDFGDVATSFVRKMRSRAPYLFDGSTGVVSVERQDELWARGKASEG